jgi:hypothetical protein
MDTRQNAKAGILARKPPILLPRLRLLKNDRNPLPPSGNSTPVPTEKSLLIERAIA